MRKQNAHLAHSGPKLTNSTVGGQNQLKPVLSAQGHILEPPPSPINTLSGHHVLKKATKHEHLLCPNQFAHHCISSTFGMDLPMMFMSLA
jgi:hypothetical protein